MGTSCGADVFLSAPPKCCPILLFQPDIFVTPTSLRWHQKLKLSCCHCLSLGSCIHSADSQEHFLSIHCLLLASGRTFLGTKQSNHDCPQRTYVPFFKIEKRSTCPYVNIAHTKYRLPVLSVLCRNTVYSY